MNTTAAHDYQEVSSCRGRNKTTLDRMQDRSAAICRGGIRLSTMDCGCGSCGAMSLATIDSSAVYSRKSSCNDEETTERPLCQNREPSIVSDDCRTLLDVR